MLLPGGSSRIWMPDDLRGDCGDHSTVAESEPALADPNRTACSSRWCRETGLRAECFRHHSTDWEAGFAGFTLRQQLTRRWESTAVYRACQERTTTSSILNANLRTVGSFAGNRLWRIAARRILTGEALNW